MRTVYSIFTIIIFCFIEFQSIQAQTLIQTAKKAEQHARELKQQENSRYESIKDTKDLVKYKQYISDYPKGKNTPDIQKRYDEIEFWNKTKQENSILAFEKYLVNTKLHWFDSEARENINIIRKTQEKDAWNKVKTLNSIYEYKNYLIENPNSGYRVEAEKEINKLEGSEVWQTLKNTNSILELQKFISSYPNANEISLAQNKLYELKGRQYFDRGDLKAAYSEFSHLSRNQISISNRNAYDESFEYHDFSNLSPYSSESILLSFLKKYPNGKYSNQVSNMLAIVKARTFGDYATNYDYNQALNYAKDVTTKNTVNSYISLNKRKQKQREKAYKSWERSQNGGLFNIGLDFMDFAYNWNTDDRSVLYYNIGLLLRIGNFKDRVQFAIGLKPGLIGYDNISLNSDWWSDYTYETTEWKTSFHMPIIGQLKLNLFNTSENSRFFIYGQYQYNAIKVDYVESDMAWSAGIGMAWKNFDWSFYYRQDIGSPMGWTYKKQNYIGISLIYYWQLNK